MKGKLIFGSKLLFLLIYVITFIFLHVNLNKAIENSNNLNSLDLKKSMRVIRPILDSLEHFNKAYMYDILLNKINKEKIIDHV